MNLQSFVGGARAAGLGLLVSGLAAAWALAPAHGQTNTLASAGAWEAFGGTTKETKKRLCGVSMSAGGRYFGIKYFDGDDDFTVQLGNKNWTVKDGAKIELRLAMDNHGSWKAVAEGFHFSDGDAGLEFNVSFKKISEFMDEFRASNLMRVSFDSKSVSDWQVSLSGTNAVSNAMLICLRTMR